MKSINSTRQLNADAAPATGGAPAAAPVEAAKPKVVQPMLPVVSQQHEMFGGLFKAEGDLAKGLNVTDNDRGLSIKMHKRSGKGTSLASITGKVGDELTRWERTQTDALFAKQLQALQAAYASGLYTGQSFRIGRNGNLGINARFVGVKAVTLDNASKEQVAEQAKKLGLKVS